VIDVAVIGGGPAGLLAATHLADAGLDVVLFEEHPKVGEPVHCTGIVSLETADLAKVPDDLILGRLTWARLYGPRGAVAEHAWRADESERIFAIDRAGFDRGLAERAQAAGAILLTGARVHDVHVEHEAVTVQTRGDDLRARACVLACGVSYRFQRLLGLGLPGQAIHTAQIEVAALPGDTVELHFGREVARDGFAWSVPVLRDGQSRLKVGVMARGDAGARLAAFLARDDVRARLLEAPPPPVRRLLPLKPIARTYGDRLLVVGDAGGFTKPTTGGGIFYSLLTATLAAETLIEGFNAGRLDEAFLARYERRWQERLGQDLRVADWLRQVVTKCSDAEIDLLVRALGTEDVQALIRKTARFNWHRDLIVTLVRQPRIAGLLFRTLFR
jgi:geranylgeranyl reductase family protein